MVADLVFMLDVSKSEIIERRVVVSWLIVLTLDESTTTTENVPTSVLAKER